jgi:hypothetical protein
MISAGASGNGNGTVSINAVANTGTAARMGTVTVAGKAVTISQSACTYTISPIAANGVGKDGGPGGPVSVNTQSGCPWTAGSNVSWLGITSGASGSGNGSVRYTVASNNTGNDRTGTLTIAGQTFTVMQKK